MAPEAVSMTLLGPGVTELTKANSARGSMKDSEEGRRFMAIEAVMPWMLSLKSGTVSVHFAMPLHELACFYDPDTFRAI
ncbi:hypothetical protein GCM10010975_16140 [Comamonas phosphati]|nr:hypothetical protein GCM10010975_16140 [Comamonas phosphati]